MFGMFQESFSQPLMLALPILVSAFLYWRRPASARLMSAAIGAAFIAAGLYICLGFLAEGFGPLFMVGWMDTFLLYIPICFVTVGGFILARNGARRIRADR